MLVTMTARDALCHEGVVTVTGASDTPESPGALPAVRLLPAQPSPFSRTTTICYELPAGGPVRLQIYDLAGRRVRTLVQQSAASPGAHRVVWDGRDAQGIPVPAGVYACRLEAGATRVTERVIRLR